MTLISLFFSAFVVLLCYLLGSIPSGYLAGKWLSNIDLRELGSGSTGATNVLRHIGKGPALAVFLIDVGKGTLAVVLAKMFLQGDGWEVLGGISALIGHIWPIWLNWQGGKAVATGLGVLLGLSWPVGLSCFVVFLAVFFATKIVSLSSIVAAISLPILMLISFRFTHYSHAYMAVCLMAMSFVLWRHRSNFNRLVKGTEPRIGKF
ncbi:glycerol-3-phosphate 1-O-acyltransferase PlsY [Prochlorococcus sp. MIT 1341]|uniref:glycerol-3-phosphate 1-O-acyltransferase PlsY n=1 Tax=Prochlorococcus sp. MIT 1341 TaxID=3096221 RepID=UPI002A75A070|nr:glycerol-3-phosphate 1-O-acyltransferase PlsY [Prochlorococcus sp. MIT 1341]